MNPTDFFVFIVIGVCLAWEAWALVNRRPGDTISESFWRISKRPLVPFLAGLLCGHFFWQMQDCFEAFK